MALPLGLALLGSVALKTYYKDKELQLRRDELGLRKNADTRAQQQHDVMMEESEEKLEGVRTLRQARRVGERAASDYDTLAAPRKLGMVERAELIESGTVGEEGAEIEDAGIVRPTKPAKAKPFYIAENVAEFLRSKGRNDEAQKVLTKTYLDAIAENEARYNFELMPRMQELRAKNLDAEALKSDRNFQQLQWEMYQTAVNNLGHMYGLLKTGNKADAIRAFNASGAVMPGVQVADIRVEQGQDGTPMVIAYDKEGRPVNGRDGQPVARPQAWFERVWTLSQQQTLKLGKGESIVNVTKQPDGTMKVEPAYTAPDPDAARRRDADALATDKAWGEAINKNRDDAAKYLKDTLGLTPNALGQIMNPDNQPIFELALPKVTAKLQAARAEGKKLDQIDGVAIAKDALKEAREEHKRAKAGAGPRNPSDRSRPTVKDIIGG